KDNGDDRCRLLYCSGSECICDNDVDLHADKFGCDFGVARGASLRPAVFNRNGATLDPAEFTQPLHESSSVGTPGRSVRAQQPDGRQLARLLRASGERRHATTVLLKSLMNSRRLIASPASRTKSGIKRLSHFWTENCAVRRTQCPLWVKSRHRDISGRCPLYLQKQTLIERVGC